MQERRAAGLALIVISVALSGCATTFSDSQYSSLPPSPRPLPSTSGTASAVVTAPALAHPTERLPTGDYADVLDRIRAGFQLPDVGHYEVDRQVEAMRRSPDYLDRTFRRGSRYLHHIVNEVERRGLPMELALLPVVESAFNPVAYSRSRASGLWQFIPSTGKHYGLSQNWWMDERRDVLEATSAALDYLTYLHRYFDGDWLLAIASYNGGEGTVSRAVQRNLARGRPADFFSLDLVTETRQYVPKLLAVRRLVADPAAYGLAFQPIPNTAYFTVVDPGRQMRLDEVAELAGVSKDEVFALNPAFNRLTTPPDGPHRLLLPVASAPAFVQALNEGRVAEVKVANVYHLVRRGESLTSIASRHGVTLADLRAANGLRGSTIQPGQQLTVPVAGARSASIAEPRPDLARQLPEREVARAPQVRRHTVRSGESLWSIARLYGVSVPSLAAENSLASNSRLTKGQALRIPGGKTRLASAADDESVRMTYKVRRGDTLSEIAEKFNVSVRQLMSWNKIRQSTSLRAGQQLVLYVDPARVSGG